VCILYIKNWLKIGNEDSGNPWYILFSAAREQTAENRVTVFSEACSLATEYMPMLILAAAKILAAT
jgi:hypothetical protein